MTLLTTRIETGSDKLKLATLVSFKERKSVLLTLILNTISTKIPLKQCKPQSFSMTELLTEISLRKKTNK